MKNRFALRDKFTSSGEFVYDQLALATYLCQKRQTVKGTNNHFAYVLDLVDNVYSLLFNPKDTEKYLSSPIAEVIAYDTQLSQVSATIQLGQRNPSDTSSFLQLDELQKRIFDAFPLAPTLTNDAASLRTLQYNLNFNGLQIVQPLERYQTFKAGAEGTDAPLAFVIPRGFSYEPRLATSISAHPAVNANVDYGSLFTINSDSTDYKLKLSESAFAILLTSLVTDRDVNLSSPLIEVRKTVTVDTYGREAENIMKDLRTIEILFKMRTTVFDGAQAYLAYRIIRSFYTDAVQTYLSESNTATIWVYDRILSQFESVVKKLPAQVIYFINRQISSGKLKLNEQLDDIDILPAKLEDTLTLLDAAFNDLKFYCTNDCARYNLADDSAYGAALKAVEITSDSIDAFSKVGATTPVDVYNLPVLPVFNEGVMLGALFAAQNAGALSPLVPIMFRDDWGLLSPMYNTAVSVWPYDKWKGGNFSTSALAVVGSKLQYIYVRNPEFFDTHASTAHLEALGSGLPLMPTPSGYTPSMVAPEVSKLVVKIPDINVAATVFKGPQFWKPALSASDGYITAEEVLKFFAIRGIDISADSYIVNHLQNNNVATTAFNYDTGFPEPTPSFGVTGDNEKLVMTPTTLWKMPLPIVTKVRTHSEGTYPTYKLITNTSELYPIGYHGIIGEV